MRAQRVWASKAVTSVAVGFLLFTGTSVAIDNSWKVGNGDWHIGGNWSATIPPTNGFDTIWITNTVAKTVTINATTAGTYPGTLTISNLTVRGTSANTLALTTGGSTAPLRLINGLTVGRNGSVMIANSSLRVDGLSGGAFVNNGLLQLDSGMLNTTNVEARIGNDLSGRLTVIGGTWLAKTVMLGCQSGVDGTLMVAGGTVQASGSLSCGGWGAATATGTVWLTGGQLIITNAASYIGEAGVGQIIVSNGEYQAQTILIGSEASSQGSLTVVGGSVSADKLVATNINSRLILNGGTLVSRATIVSNGLDFVIGDTVSNAVFNAIGGTHTIQNDLVVGLFSRANQLLVTNAAAMLCASGYIGNWGDSNTALVTGPGSVWENAAALTVGYSSCGNALIIANSGAVSCTQGHLGGSYRAKGNTVLVTGSGSAWSNNAGLVVGYSGSGNTLTITNRAAVFSAGGSVGYWDDALSNAVIVVGAGSVWSNSASLAIGYRGLYNTLSIANGGAVFNASTFLGGYRDASSNTVVVTGTGSVWSNRGYISIGLASSCNALTITNGGSVFNGDAYIGDWNTAPSNGVLVTGSVWNNSGDLIVGNNSFDNILTITNRGTVFGVNGYIGYNNGANSNTVRVDGSVWSNRNALSVGLVGHRNALTIANSGTVFSTHGYIGHAFDVASNNTVLVTDAGSAWYNTAWLHIGYNGEGNQLTIANGGTVVNTVGDIGSAKTANNNKVLVTGSGSAWNNLASIIVGSDGVANSLMVSNGGTVRAGSWIVLGFSAASQSNALTVADGTVIVTNSTHSGTLEVRGGTLTLSGTGVIQVDRLVMTNAGAALVRNGGTLCYTTAVLDPTADVDGDGLPNGWELANNLDPFSAAGATEASDDPDEDGVDNMNEYSADTDPQNPDSHLRVTGIDILPSGNRVDWIGGVWARQYLEVRQSLGGTTEQWTAVFTNLPPTATVTNIIDAGATNRVLFYRIKAER